MHLGPSIGCPSTAGTLACHHNNLGMGLDVAATFCGEWRKSCKSLLAIEVMYISPLVPVASASESLCQTPT